MGFKILRICVLLAVAWSVRGQRGPRRRQLSLSTDILKPDVLAADDRGLPPTGIQNPVLQSAAKDAAVAVKERKDALETAARNSPARAPSGPGYHASARHFVSRASNPKELSISSKSRIFEEVTRRLLQKTPGDPRVNALKFRHLKLRGTSLERLQEECERERVTERCEDSKFRTLDGTCNNLANPEWGRSLGCMKRFLPPAYTDGVSEPRLSVTGRNLPNPRTVSTTVHVEQNVPSRDFTHMVMQWAQFLDHDFALAPFSAESGELSLTRPFDFKDCCDPANQADSQCLPISLPRDDAFFSRFKQVCMNFIRSAPCQCEPGPRQQFDRLTSWVDASQIYGSDDIVGRLLRSFKGGRLRSVDNNPFSPLLPPSVNQSNDGCSQPRSPCFLAGDERVNEQPALTALHTIWLRQHNKVVATLQELNPHWDDERLYLEGRRIISAQFALITYRDDLPIILGPGLYKRLGLAVLKEGFTTYNPTIDGTIRNEFASAAYRFGHTLINGMFEQLNQALRRLDPSPLQENFFFPFEFYRGQMDLLLRGLLNQRAQQFDRFIDDDVTNHLYRFRNESFGMDLVALNLARGREHAIQPYIRYLEFCYKEKITSFDDLVRYMAPETVAKYRLLYESVEDIDLFTGGVSEYPEPGGVLGPTFGCLVGLQLNLLKYGDRYYFEHGGQTGSFTPEQLQSIRKFTTWASIICHNANDIKEIQLNPFRAPTRKEGGNPVISCKELTQIDLLPWKEGGSFEKPTFVKPSSGVGGSEFEIPDISDILGSEFNVKPPYKPSRPTSNFQRPSRPSRPSRPERPVFKFKGY